MQATAQRTTNSELVELVTLSDNESPLNQGISMVARNRVLVGLANPAGLSSLMYDPETDSIDNVRARIRAAGEWLIKVADEAE